MKMRVCDVVMNSIWYDPRVRRQLVEYRNANVDVLGIGLKCSRFDAEKILDIPVPVKIVALPDRFLGKQNVWGKIVRRYLQFKLIRDEIIAANPDIIHANDLDALIPSYFAQRKLKCHLLYDSHEVYAENFQNKGKLLAFISCILSGIEKRLVKKVDQMVCVSHAAAEYFESTYHIVKPLVVTNCALASDYTFDASLEKNEGFEVLNHGQFYEGRGYDIMAQACDYFADYPNIRLAVRGFGKMESVLHEMVAQCSHKEQFRFYPRVLVQELIPMAAKSHVGVAITEPICLNFELTVSNKLFEYAAAGLPVIMSDLPEHRFLNHKYDFGLILPENTPEAFAEAVKLLHDNQQLYQRLSSNAKKMTRELTWENEFQKLLLVERAMLERN